MSLVISMMLHGALVVACIVLAPRADRAEDEEFVLSIRPPRPRPETVELQTPTVASSREPEPEPWEEMEEREPEAAAEEEFIDYDDREERTPETPALRFVPAVRLARPLVSQPTPLQTMTAPPPRRAPRPAPQQVAAQPARKGVFRPARPLASRCPPAEYPRRSRRMGHQGEVVLLLLVEKDGTLGSVEVETSSGFAELDRAAIAAVHLWHFSPARRDGLAVAHQLRIPFRFRLD